MIKTGRNEQDLVNSAFAQPKRPAAGPVEGAPVDVQRRPVPMSGLGRLGGGRKGGFGGGFRFGPRMSRAMEGF